MIMSKKENLPENGLFRPGSTQSKIKRKTKREINITTLLENKKKNYEHEGDGDTDSNWCVRNNPQRIAKVIRRIRNQRIGGSHTDNSIIKIG